MTASMAMTCRQPVILASTSSARHQLLRQVGLPHRCVVSPFDEEAAKPAVATWPIPDQACHLAAGKAMAVSALHPDALVLAADQIAEFEGQPLFKPHTAAANKAVLKRLSGRTHFQHSAACLYHQGVCVQTFHEKIALTMRHVSDDEISAYVAADQPMACCAGYRYEGLGKWLFASVSGSVEGIMGLPLQSILSYLAEAGWVTMRA